MPGLSPAINCYMSRRLASTLFALLLLLTILIYWHGLHGPFLLDDIGNLEPIKRWLDGSLNGRSVIFDNRSGLLGRPLSVSTFLLDAMRTGNMDSFTFKPTNLLIHLLCGVTLWALLRKILQRDSRTSAYSEELALFLSAIWLLAPLQVSTVLYVVQRMAQLAALFMLCALLVYMTARQRITKKQRYGYALLWLGLPLLTILAAFSKENGLLALPLAMVLEITLFAPRNDESRPKGIQAFFFLSVWLPAAIAVVWLISHPSFIAGGYITRDFTLEQRLLTEPRVLWCYIQTMLLPVGSRMGIYHDNFPISTSLTNPWTTLPALLGWLILTALAWRWRHRKPLFAAGVFFYLMGQAMESSFIGLELYFEHRNYLPSVGILLVLAEGLGMIASHLSTKSKTRQRTIAGLLLALPLMYAFGAWGQVTTFSSDRLFYAMQEVYNPTSPRLESDLTARAMLAGDLNEALRHIAISERNSPASEKMTATIWRFLAYCETRHPPPAFLYREFASRDKGPISNFSMIGWELLAGRIERGCPGIDSQQLSQEGEEWLRHNPLPRGMQNTWRTRYNLARIVAASGNITKAAKIDHKAWVESRYNNGIGVFLFQLNASLGNTQACRDVLTHLEAAAHGSGDFRLTKTVTAFRAALNTGQIHP